MKKQLKTENAPKAIGPYSQGIESNGFTFISGQIPLNPKTGEMKTDVKAATAQVLDNMKAILKSNGMTLDDVVKTTVFMTNLDDFPKMNEVYETQFLPPYPARSTIGVSALPKGAVVEIECIATKTKTKKEKK